jgi:MHS family proline/betaine transporter-like MFS transporter
LGLSLVTMLGTMSAALPAIFPTHVRYGSLSVAYNLATSIFGGTTPLVITALISAFDSTLMPAYYSTGAAVIGVIAVLCMKETANKPLAGSPPSVETEAEAAKIVEEQAPRPRF